MPDRRQLVALGAAIVFMFACIGYAQADDTNEGLSEVRADLEIADGADIATEDGTDIRATADVGGDQDDVIEEIVVIGTKRRRHSNLGSSGGTDPVVQKPARIDLQFLPTYDPVLAYPYIDQVQLDDQIRRAGFIELFRVRFGR